MSKFAIGERVENVADDHESAVFPLLDGTLTRRGTA